jgi:hypothetical protein
MIHFLTEDLDICGPCGRKVTHAHALGFFVRAGVPDESIAYPFCSECARFAATGLPPALLSNLDTRVQARLRELEASNGVNND